MRTLLDPVAIGVKAAVAVAGTLALVLAFGLSDSISATFAALVCISPVAVTGLRLGVAQVAASAIGGVITSLLLVTLGHSSLVLALAMGLTVWGSFAAGFPHGYLFAGFTVIYVFLVPADSPTLALEQRLAALVVGALVATAVNMAVGLLLSGRIFRRRVGLIREALAGAFEREEEAARAGGGTDPGAAFDQVFPHLWALGSELSDARRGTWMRRRLEASVTSFWSEVRALARLAHLGKELGLHLEHAPAEPRFADALEALAHGVRAQSDVAPDAGDAAWAPLQRRAAAALREANEATKTRE